MQILHETYGAAGLTVITVMFEDASHAAADLALAQLWETTFSLTHPVWADPTGVSTAL